MIWLTWVALLCSTPAWLLCHGLYLLRNSTFLRQEGQGGSRPSSKRQEVAEEDRPSCSAALSPNKLKSGITYLQCVKQAFKDNGRVYDEFIGVLQDFRAERVTVPEVVAKVKVLFKDHRDLILGFNTFLPEDYAIKVENSLKRLVDFDQAIELVQKIKARSHQDGHPYQDLLKTLLKFRDGKLSSQDVGEEVGDLLRNYPDLLVGFTCFLPENTVAGCLQQVETLENDIDDMKSRSEQHNNPSYLPCIAIMREHDKRATSRIPLVEGGILNRLWEKVDFLNLVKGRLHMGESFQEFLKCLHMYSDGLITGEDLSILVSCLFQKSPELIGHFNNLVSHCETAELCLISWEEQEGLGEKAGKQDSDKRADNAVGERHVEQEKETKKHVSRDVINRTSLDSSPGMNKPVSELDLSKSERCTTSYRLLPEAYRLANSGYRTPLGHAVLNDTWVSVTSGSEDFKNMQKNEYEKSLSRCEEDRCELDVLLESTESTITCVEELLKMVEVSKIEEGIHIDDHLTAMQLRRIEHIYDSHGLEVIDQLRQRPGDVLPVVLNRLRQKHGEWLRYKAKMNIIWAEVCAKNHHKSLDNCSIQFKQQDTKTLSSKALLAEIKETNAKKRRSDDFIFSIASGNSNPIIPDLKLDYQDAGIYEDLYRILKHSAKGVCANVEQLEKVMHVWKTFLGTMLGSRHGLQETQKISKGKSVRPQDNVISINDTAVNGERTLTGVDLQTVMRPIYDEMEGVKQGVFETWAFHRREIKQDAGIQSNRLRSDSNIAFPMTDITSINCGIDDTDRLQCPEKEDGREEGELSPSQDADEKFMEFHSSSTPVAEVVLCEGVSKHFVTHTTKEGRESDHKGENGSTAKGFCDNVGVTTHRIGEGRHNSESESGDMVSGNERNLKTGGAEEIAHSDNDGSVKEDWLTQRCLPLFPISKSSISIGGAPEGHSVLFYGNDNMYILLRLHQVLHERIRTAKVYAAAASRESKAGRDDSPHELYHTFLQALYDFVDGTAVSAKFEDVCRSICGNQSYLFSTLDMLVLKLVKQLQVVASDEMATKLLELHRAYQHSHAPHGPVDSVYHANASVLLHNQDVYRFERRVETGQLYIQLMDGCANSRGAFAIAMHSTAVKCRSNFLPSNSLERSQRDPLFLKRNMPSYATDDEQMEVLKDVCIANGLELKISFNPFKCFVGFFHSRHRGSIPSKEVEGPKHGLC